MQLKTLNKETDDDFESKENINNSNTKKNNQSLNSNSGHNYLVRCNNDFNATDFVSSLITIHKFGRFGIVEPNFAFVHASFMLSRKDCSYK